MKTSSIQIAFLIVWLAGCSSEPVESNNAVSFIASCDTDGWIVPCGCSAKQSGGLLRRATLIADRLGDDAKVILDVGGAAAGVSGYHRMKLEAIIQGEMAMGLAAHNIGASEAAFGPDVLRDIGKQLNVPFVSANTTDGNGNPIAPSYRMAVASGKRFAVVGVLDPAFATRQIKVKDPQQSVLDTIKEIDGKADAILVLGYLKRENLEQIAEQLPEVDVVIGGPTGQSIPPKKPASTWLASTTNKGKFVVRFRYDVSNKDLWHGSIIEIDDTLADEPAQTENLSQFYQKLGSADFAATETGLARQTLTHRVSGEKFAGNQQCQQCHVEDCTHWAGTKHAHAWETLVSKHSHVDPFCQQCHTTGYGQSGGFLSNRQSPLLVDVGCESCHGPSAEHAQLPERRTGIFASDSCLSCHDQENSPSFVYEEYWKSIVHGAKIAGKNGVEIGDRSSPKGAVAK